MNIKEKKKRLLTLPWYALHDIAISSGIPENEVNVTLRFLAGLSGKKVVFIELDELSQLISVNNTIECNN